MKKFEQNIPESYSLFKRKFLFALDKANATDTTIFTESIDLSKINEELIFEHYTYFNRNYRSLYDSVQDSNQKINIINESINESYFQHNFNKVLDAVLESGQISISTEYLLENTVEKLNLDLSKVGKSFLESDKTEEIKPLEENVFGATGAALAGAFGAGLSGMLAVGGIAALAGAIFLPARASEKLEENLRTLVGKPLAAILGAGNIWKTGFTPNIENSYNNIIKFDNIDADTTVKNLFLKIQKIGPNVKEVRNGLESIAAECVSQNKDILMMDPNQKENIIASLHNTNPKDYNIFKLAAKGIFGKANSDRNDYGTLLRYRKCLSNKLVDIYKLLLITNLQNAKNHREIISKLSKTNSNPENILSFIPNDTSEDVKLREAILALIQFRIYLTELATNLEKGMFKVDEEAGRYLKQKLSTVDGEVENYLRLNKNKYREPYEGNLNTTKISPIKRSLLSNRSSL